MFSVLRCFPKVLCVHTYLHTKPSWNRVKSLEHTLNLPNLIIIVSLKDDQEAQNLEEPEFNAADLLMQRLRLYAQKRTRRF